MLDQSRTREMPSYWDGNFAALQTYHPQLATAIMATPFTDEVDISFALSGHPIPMVNNRPLHSTQNPVEEGEQFAGPLVASLVQQRVFILGFGFGYHVRPFVRQGLSPRVYEPSLGVLRLALACTDLRDILPFVSIEYGPRPTDFPLDTLKVGFQPICEAFPQDVQRISSQVDTWTPPKSNDVLEGIYRSTYRGVSCLKNPIDMVIYQMLFWLVRPTLVIELGVHRGGSTLYLADLLRQLGGERRIYAFDIVDLVPQQVLDDPMITFSDKGWQAFDASVIRPEDRVLIIEDSSHTYENTLQVLQHFAPLVTPNSYFIVEDGRAGENRPSLNGGPIRAIEEFLATDNRYEPDTRLEHFYGPEGSFCLKGFLRRKPNA